jgi:hypothetical protein
MLRLKLEYFEFKPDEGGYASEVNRKDCLQFTVDPGEGNPDIAFAKLVSVLQQFLGLTK